MFRSTKESHSAKSRVADDGQYEDTTHIILATVYPKPGKAERIIELYQPIIKDGATKEPGCIQFQLFLDINAVTGNEEIFTIEKFKTLAELRKHQQGESLKQFNIITEEEGLHAKPVLVHIVRQVSGFSI